jgi:hypothetical protein
MHAHERGEAIAVSVWHVVAIRHTSDPGSWVLRVTQSTADGGRAGPPREVTDVEEACALLRRWFARAASSRLVPP